MASNRELQQRQISGLLLIAVALLILVLSRARMHDLFPPGWWRLW